MGFLGFIESNRSFIQRGAGEIACTFNLPSTAFRHLYSNPRPAGLACLGLPAGKVAHSVLPAIGRPGEVARKDQVQLGASPGTSPSFVITNCTPIGSQRPSDVSMCREGWGPGVDGGEA